MAENGTLVKNRSEIVRIMISWLRQSLLFLLTLRTERHKSSVKLQRDPSFRRFGGHFRNTERGCINPSPVPARVRTFIRLGEAHIRGSEELVLEIRSSNVIYVCECLRCVSSLLSRSPFFSDIAWCAAWASLLQSNLVFCCLQRSRLYPLLADHERAIHRHGLPGCHR